MLILVFIIGFLLITRLPQRVSLLERMGFALPIGLTAITLGMALMDWANVGLTRTSLSILTIVLVLVVVAVNIAWLKSGARRLRGVISAPKKGVKEWLSVDLSWFNLLWLLMFIAVVYLEVINYTKCMMYPTYDRDSMAAFDTIGYVCAQEHCYHGMSIFDAAYFPRMHEAGSSVSYLPMIQLSYAYVYIFGATTSKAIPALIYLGFLFGFYGLCRRKLSHTASMLALLGIILAPEMTSFASHSITNVMHACVASAGVVYACLWIKDRQSSLLWLSIMLLAANCWMRAEGIVFAGVAWLLILIVSIRRKEWKTGLLPLLSLLPMVFWAFYSSSCGLTSESAIITHPFWDASKAQVIFDGFWSLLSEGTFYGWTFHLLAIAVVADFYFVIKGKSSAWVLIALVISILGYYFVLYQIDYKWDSIYNVLAYSAKRFFFCFVPMAWYCIVTTYPAVSLFKWVEKTLGLGIKFGEKGSGEKE